MIKFTSRILWVGRDGEVASYSPDYFYKEARRRVAFLQNGLKKNLLFCGKLRWMPWPYSPVD